MACLRAPLLRLLLGASLCFSAFAGLAAAPGGDFSLTDQNGGRFDLQQLRGKVVVLLFGYTYCPDICPTELSNLAAVFDALQAQASQVRGVFVSLDPERDTPKVLKDYVGYFSPDLIGLTGSPQAIARVARQYKVKYSKHATANGGYSLDHSANLYVIDKTGKLDTVVPYGLPPEHLLRVVRSLLENKG